MYREDDYYYSSEEDTQKNEYEIMEYQSLEKQLEKKFGFIPSVYIDDDKYVVKSSLTNRNPIEFLEYTIKRNINTLIHFTKVNNLENILKYGLLSRSALDNKNIDYIPNDNDRLDNFKDAIFLSVTFPNYLLLEKFRNKYKAFDWGVILLYKDIIWEKECLYSNYNSANSYYSKQLHDHEDYGKNNINYFKKFFREKHGGFERGSKMPDNMPTNSQTEVIVFDKIEPRYIKGIHFENYIPKKLKKYKNYIKIKQSKKYFKER